MFELPQSLNLTTLVYMAVASSLAWLGGWLKGRRKDRAEIDKLQAETRQIHTSSDIAPLGITLETFREIQSVIKKAEDRREEWQTKEDQMRTQILFWRNKAEELDGQLIDSREANGLLESRANHQSNQNKRLKGLLDEHQVPYAEIDQPPHK